MTTETRTEPKIKFKWFKAFFKLLKPQDGLRLHNNRIKKLLSEDGKKELNKLVVLEAALLAHIHHAAKIITEKGVSTLISETTLSENEIDETEVDNACKEKGFFEKLTNKCKSVANNIISNKAKGFLSDDD